MNDFNYAREVEDIAIGLKNLTGLSYAVYEALYRGAFSPDTYEGAVYILLQEAQRLSDASERLILKMFDSQKRAKKG